MGGPNGVENEKIYVENKLKFLTNMWHFFYILYTPALYMVLYACSSHYFTTDCGWALIHL